MRSHVAPGMLALAQMLAAVGASTSVGVRQHESEEAHWRDQSVQQPCAPAAA